MAPALRQALVTGGARRIGAALCRALAADGWGVVIHYRQSETAAQQLADELRRAGGRAWTLAADLSQPAAAEELMAAAWQVTGGCELLVNNASVFLPDTVRAPDTAAATANWQVNLMAPLLLTGAFARRAARGHIVNLLDRRVTALDPRHVSYVLSKRALRDFTLLAARDLAPAIRVNAIAPGAILPPPNRNAIPVAAGAAPLAQPCQPADVAAALRFLLAQPVYTGQILYVDAGQHLLTDTP